MLELRGTKIAEDLRFVFECESPSRFDLDDQFVFNQKVGVILAQ